jgi:hypothetical protein
MSYWHRLEVPGEWPLDFSLGIPLEVYTFIRNGVLVFAPYYFKNSHETL